MNRLEFNQLLETAARRKLTADEEARLQAHLAAEPLEQAAWEEELALSRLLNRLPDAPLASNFTAQVLLAIQSKTGRRRHLLRIPHHFGWPRPARQFAAACLVLSLVALGYFQYQSARREKFATSLAGVTGNLDTVSDVTSLPPAEVWENFDAINRLNQTQPQADEQLLAALNQIAMK